MSSGTINASSMLQQPGRYPRTGPNGPSGRVASPGPMGPTGATGATGATRHPLRPTGNDAGDGVRGLGIKRPRGKDNRPNIVLFMVDDQHFRDVAKMPHVRKLQHQGTSVKNAIIENPLCCPSRATTLSGKYSPTTGVEYLNGSDFDDKSTLATWLKQAGYKTSLVGKYLNEYPFHKPKHVPKGWTDWASFHDQPKGGANYYNYDWFDNKAKRKIVHHGRAGKDYSTDVINKRVQKFIRTEVGEGKNGKRTPALMVVTPYGPHALRTAAPRYDGIYDKTPVKLPPAYYERDLSDKSSQFSARPQMTPKEARKETREAWASSRANDDAVRDIRKALAKKGELKNTIFVYMSDQGYSMGEHGWTGKQMPYETAIRTPMFISGPGIPKAKRDFVMSNADIAPTLAGFAGVRAPGDVDGRNLAPVLRGRKPADRDRAVLIHQPAGKVTFGNYGEPNEKLGFWGVRTERFKYIETRERDGSTLVELYDLKNDPNELKSVNGKPAYAAVEADLKRRLGQMRARQSRNAANPDLSD